MAKLKQKTPERIRCSSLKQIELCPGSVRAQLGLEIGGRQREDAAAGTRVHHALELMFRNPVAQHPAILQEILGDRDNEKMVARWFYKEAQPIIEKHGGYMAMHQEVYLENDYLSGHPDLVLICNDFTVHIFDWKTGQGDQDVAKKNRQGRGYVILVHHHRDKLVGHDKHDGYYFHLFSAGNDGEDKFTTTFYTMSLVEKIEAVTERYAEAALAKRPVPERKPHFDACQFCLACGDVNACPESVHAITRPLVGKEEDDSSLDEIRLRIADEYEQLKIAERAVKRRLEKFKSAMDLMPELMDGLKLVSTGTTKKLTSASDVYDLGEELGWWEYPQFSERLSIKLSDVEELVYINKASEIGGEKAVKQHVRETLIEAGLLEEKEKSPRLALNKPRLAELRARKELE